MTRPMGAAMTASRPSHRNAAGSRASSDATRVPGSKVGDGASGEMPLATISTTPITSSPTET